MEGSQGKLYPSSARFSPAPPRYSYFSSFSPSMNPANSSTVGGSEPSSLCSNNALCFARRETNCSWPMLPTLSVLVGSSSSLVTLMLIVLDAISVLSVDSIALDGSVLREPQMKCVCVRFVVSNVKQNLTSYVGIPKLT